ncbi:tetratricopeptide repeat-containing sensor histidine kinase [Polaribacter dokdonensis]|uniref:Oxygen sensor histidine kinase NreB n=1 Tax=Polaribacter dokdonensis DSW-5 TaxID=1300348 RepID=A0A0M9CEN1_9FLAO|nr:tetratricopeptide repeat-containing sensor histidine kinase [Polaribacter dokdonensis]KOY51111.1 Two-component system sensor histidine kinase [Polaribacter dokdonensis DSW-5]SEE18477.1 Signal transduction histidine kinase [Polaribacter dokdonensis DSW-5]
MKNKILILLAFFTILKAFSETKKETFNYKVSFLQFQDVDSTNLQKFALIEKQYKDKDYEQSLEGALILLKSDIDPLLRYKINMHISEIFRVNNNHKKAIEYLLKSVDIFEKSTSLDGLSSPKDVKYLVQPYFMLANEYLRLELKDSAKVYYDKVLNFNGSSKEIMSFKAKTSSTLSGIYMQDSLYSKAKEYAQAAITIHRQYNNKISESAALGNLASIYLSQNEFKKSKSIYEEALDLIKHEGGDRALRIKQQLYYNLAYNLYKLEDHEAYKAQEESYNLKDAQRDKEIRRIIENLEKKYNFDIEKEYFLEQAKNKRLEEQRIFWGVAIACLLIIFSLIYVIKLNNLKQNNLALKLSETKLLQNQQIDKIKSETQVRILNATIDGKESERKQIAETLHDSVSALLSSANLHLQATRKQFNGSTPVEIDKTQQIIIEASHKIRDLSHTLVSSVLLKFGLNFAVKEIASKYSNSELVIETDIQNIQRYHQNFEIKVYNIISEFINNILKHSRAKRALITIIEENGRLFITIQDNGVGFDKTKINEKNGLGLNQIDARIQIMKGYFNIDSSKKKGTKISIELPVIEREIMTHV